MSEEIKVGFCMGCFKNINYSDKEFIAVPVKVDGEFSHNRFYHIECYEDKTEV